MRLRAIAALAALFNSVSAFRDASPFFLISTSQLSSDASHLQSNTALATARNVAEHLGSTLHRCPTSTYYIISQPGVLSSDFNPSTSPYLYSLLKKQESQVLSAHTVTNVIGDLGSTDPVGTVTGLCGGEGKISHEALESAALPSSSKQDGARIIQVKLDAISGSNQATRERQLAKADSYIRTLVSTGDADFTLVYHTTPPATEEKEEVEDGYELSRDAPRQVVYQMDEPWPSGSVKAEHFKRDTSAFPRRDDDDDDGTNLNVDVPLFEKYQFLSAGIFMGVTVTLLLLTILYVGLGAVSGLEVSYMAFSKEMGPQKQKPQQ